ncbi:pectate lyase [Bacillus sp. JCM 19041]|uniref:pectate lyase n=1 Tax=Bacillus sp. JCM 19041 TaxID=1460637 RepID=UPI0006CF890E
MKALYYLSSLATISFAACLFVLSPSGQTAEASVITEADHLLTWQMEHGGWTKDMPEIYTRDWNGNEPRSVWTSNGQELGTIDNDATVSEILVVAEAYQETGDPRYKESVHDGIDFLFKLQYPSGGFRQVYPQRGLTLPVPSGIQIT